MGPNQFIKKIRIYAFISFLLPLVTINTCLLVFKLLGSVDSYPNHDWSKKKIEYTFNEFSLIAKDYDSYSISNCPKYNYYQF